MSRTITISSWLASNVTVRCRAGSSSQAGEDLLVHPRDTVRRAHEPVAIRVLADRDRGSRARRARCGSRSHSDGSTLSLTRFSRRSVTAEGGRSRDLRARAHPRAPRLARISAPASASRVSCDQQCRDETVEHRTVLDEQLPSPLVGRLDQRLHLVVDPGRDVIGVVRRRGEVPAQEHLALRVAEPHRSERVAHPELGDHLPGDRRGAGDVVGRTGRGVDEDQLLRGAAAEQHRELRQQLAAPDQETVLGRQRQRRSEGLAARDDRDPVHRIGARQRVADQRVPTLVIGDHTALGVREDPAPALGATPRPDRSPPPAAAHRSG